MDTTPSQMAPRPPEAASLPISGFVICKDEEAHIEACLASLRLCREIVVVDSGSTDRTLALIEAMRADGLPIRLIHQDWLGYASQKQFALAQATQPWCLSLDADERLDDDLQRALPVLIAAHAGTGGWRLGRLPSRMGDVAAVPTSVYAKPILRLVRRLGAHFDETALVHEGLIVEGLVRNARQGLIRHDRQLNFADQMRKELGYATLKATERVRRGRKPSALRLLVNPFLYFFRLFVLHRWFLCGHAGLVYAFTGAAYSFFAESLHFEFYGRAMRPSEARKS